MAAGTQSIVRGAFEFSIGLALMMWGATALYSLLVIPFLFGVPLVAGGVVRLFEGLADTVRATAPPTE